MSIYLDREGKSHAKCFACNAHYDSIDLIARKHNLNVSNDDDFPPQEEDGIWLIKQPHFDAEQDCEASEDGVGQKLIAFAQQMRRDAAAQKTGASGLPNANG